MAQAFLSKDSDLAEKDAAFRRALAARPSDCGCEEESFGRFLAATGRFTDANRQTERALDLLPQAPDALRQMLQGYLHVSDATRANDIVARISTQFLPDDPTPLAIRHIRAVWAGNWAEAGQTVSRHLAPDVRKALEDAYAGLTSKDAARMSVAATRLEPFAKGANADPELTEVLAALGSRNAALSALEAEVGHNEGLPPASLFDPPMAPLRDEPRYINVLEKSGLVAYWRATKSRPDICQKMNTLRLCVALR